MDEVAALREENEILQEQIRQLREWLGMEEDRAFVIRCREVFGSPRQCALMLHVLLLRGHANRAQLLASITDNPEDKEMVLVGTIMHRLRRSLGPHDIEIETIWSTGYRMSDAMRSRTWAALGMEAPHA